MFSRSTLAARLAALMAASVLCAGVAIAQTPASDPDLEAVADLETEPETEAPDEKNDIEEIKVTGKATGATTQALPEAITSFDQQQLDSMGIGNIDSLALNTPALHVGQFGAKAMITLRGVGVENISEVAEPGVGFEVDGIHMGRPISSNQTFFDLERVAVLRGPQAVEGGRQSNGGRIALTSKKASADFDAFGDFQYGSYDEFLTRVGFNIPLRDELLMSRVSLVHQKRQGYQEWKYTGVKSHNADDADSLMTRFQLRSLLADDSVELWGIGYYSYQRGNGPARNLIGRPARNLPQYAFQNFVTGTDVSRFFVACPDQVVGWSETRACNTTDPRETWSDERSRQDNSHVGFTGHAGWDMPYLAGNAFLSDMRAQLVGGYHQTVQDEIFDVDTTNAPSSYFERRTESAQGSIEAFIERPDVENFDFKAGLFYFREHVNTNFCFDAEQTATAADLGADQRLLNENFSVYTNAGYRLLDNLKVKGGVRWVREWKAALQTNRRFDPVGGTSEPPDSFPIPYDGQCGTRYNRLFEWHDPPNGSTRIPGLLAFDQDNVASDRWSSWLPSAGFDWEVTDSNSLGFVISKGLKPGGFPLGFSTAIKTQLSEPYPAEEVTEYELNFKNRFFDDDLQLNLTFFWLDYDPFQICQLAGPLYFCEGDGSATTRGIELEVEWTPIENLLINGHVNYLDARIDRFNIVDPATRNPVTGNPPASYQPVDVSGNRLPKAPEWAGSLGVQYGFDLGRWGVLTPRIQGQFQTRTYFRVFNKPEFSQPTFGKGDASLDWLSEDGRFSVRAFVNNFNDAEVINFLFVSSASLGGAVSAQYLPPRTYGLRIGVNYTSDLF